jgi:hypothetical protein
MVAARAASTTRPAPARSTPYRTTTPTPRSTSRPRRTTATAAALPTNTPAGSMADRRSASRTPSVSSMAALREMASSAANSTAVQ